MTAHPTRAEWWREVTDSDEVVQEGRWFRVECEDFAYEYRSWYDRPRSDWRPSAAVFTDTRWKPPVPPLPPLKIGDKVTSVEQLDALPIAAAVLDPGDDVWQKFMGRYGLEDLWYKVGTGRSMSSKELLRGFGPLTLIWLPEGADQ